MDFDGAALESGRCSFYQLCHPSNWNVIRGLVFVSSIAENESRHVGGRADDGVSLLRAPPGSVIPSHCHCAPHPNDRVWILASASRSLLLFAQAYTQCFAKKFQEVFFSPYVDGGRSCQAELKAALSRLTDCCFFVFRLRKTSHPQHRSAKTNQHNSTVLQPVGHKQHILNMLICGS